jgi:ABC-type multidrug transport system fused ATPase/permease subunit
MIKKIYSLVKINSFQRYLQIFALQMLIGIFFETFGLAIIFPVLDIISNPNKLEKIYVLNKLKLQYGSEIILISLPLLIILFYIIKSIYLVFLYWKQSSFSANLGEKISFNLFSIYINNPYSFHLHKNSSELLRNIKGEVLQFNEVVKSGLSVFLELMVLFSIFAILLYLDPTASICLATFGILMSYLFSKFTSKKLEKWGVVRQKVSIETSKTISHTFGAIKDVKILSIQNYFLNQFKKSNLEDVEIQKKMSTISFLPRLFLEFIAVSGLMLFILVVKIRGGNVQMLIPILGIFLASAFRMIPSINRIITAIQYINFSKPVVELLINEFKDFKFVNSKNINNEIIVENFNKLELTNITFSYEKTNKILLDNINLTINKGDIIGLIGESGVGKSTLVDIILGINNCKKGKILFNGKNIYENINNWYNQIGYIQQNVYLIDDTLGNNIALGVESDKIDQKKLTKAIEQAQLLDFVNQLELGINTMVGERGVRISGGQKQRIGIARALYNQPNFLIFDEATSNLDLQTEAAVMESIKSLTFDKTMIIIAHRKSALTVCNKIYKISNKNIQLIENT